ncbi:galactose oxidase [Hymenopellis radicata]|nr:galactose oxidase [Hymenopellis radicata]
MILFNLPLSLLASLFLAQSAAAYTSPPRWGQAVAVMDNVLYVHGGKTDEYNSYSYTSAPTNNDLLYLDLSSSFSSDSTPWQVVSRADEGPDLAWHTLSGLNSSYALLFGGLPGPNSSTVLTSQADSAWLLNIHSGIGPVWLQEAKAWGGEPVRRIRHSTVTVESGHVFIFGGELPDGSDNPITTHYLFNPFDQSFTELPTEGGPSDITGHASCILSNGTIVVFGGYSQSTNTLLPFSTIWSINAGIASENITWNSMSVATTNIPHPRRAFAATCLDGSRVLIHGGSDAEFQTTYSDGWIIDFSQDPAIWTQINALSDLGARHDHFAVAVGSSVIIGFGYGESGPAGSGLSFFDPFGGTVGSTYNSPPSTAWPTPTMPGSTQTSGGGNDGGTPQGGGGSNDNTTAIAIGTTFGVLGAFAVVVVVVWYTRRQQQRRFTILNDNDDDQDSPHSASFDGRVPVAGGFEPEYEGWTILRSIGLSGAVNPFSPRRMPERRDMLADEDTRRYNGSSWSLRSILGGNRRTREPSGASSLGTPWGEKNDPFSDGDSLMADAENGLAGAAALSNRHSGRRQFSQASTLSNVSYHDPFADPIAEEEHLVHRNVEKDHKSSLEDVEIPPARLEIQTTLPLDYATRTLSPVTEASRSLRLAHASRVTSRTSYEARSPRSSSIIDSAPKPMRRSDSWWNRFSRTSFLDRHNSGASRRGSNVLDFRDPHPPPRLIAIEESTHSANSNSPESAERVSPRTTSRHGSKVYGAHGKSTTSLRTADSEAIERMVGAMDVAQRVRTGSNRTRESTVASMSDDHHDNSSILEDDQPIVTSPVEATFVERPLSKHPLPISSALSSATSLNSAGSKQNRSSSVADRVRYFERRMTRDVTPPPTNTKQREERTRKTSHVNYGLVPRASLFVANPDHRHASSGDS